MWRQFVSSYIHADVGAKTAGMGLSGLLFVLEDGGVIGRRIAHDVPEHDQARDGGGGSLILRTYGPEAAAFGLNPCKGEPYLSENDAIHSGHSPVNPRLSSYFLCHFTFHSPFMPTWRTEPSIMTAFTPRLCRSKAKCIISLL